VPNVTGKPADRAVKELKAAPLLLTVKREPVFDNAVRKGRVVSQTPKANKTVDQGTTVTLRISQGVEQVVVPAVVGASRDAAVAALTDARLRFSETSVYSDEQPQAGVVISQSLKPEAEVDKQTTVALTISKGPLRFSLDNYVGQGLEQAKATLAGLDLTVVVKEQARPLIGPDRFGSFGRVEAQEPNPKTTVERGDTITLYTFTKAAERADD
jgi:serine/threonine-protein kinase